MEIQNIRQIVGNIDPNISVNDAKAFRSEEDGAEYHVWKIFTDSEPLVLKKIQPREKEIYQHFFSLGGPVPKVIGYFEDWMLMEYIPGHTLCRCCRDDLIVTLNALIDSQKKFWNKEAFSGIGFDFGTCYAGREKRLPYLEDLTTCYEAYLETFRSIPRTLCNDDLLPFNVVICNGRAVFLDWEYGGMLPYPCALARLIAYGEENENSLFYMKQEDQIFAVDYYYQNLIREMGISYDDYIRTMKLFFFKEYSEWIYCAGLSGDRAGEYYQKYAPLARKIAAELGYK